MSRSLDKLSVSAGVVDEEEAVHKAVHVPHTQSYIVTVTFLSAGLGNSISAVCSNPQDIIKVRQQLQLDRTPRPSFWSVGSDMVRSEGWRSLWNGVTASCLREATYSTIRIGAYESLKDFYSESLGLPSTSFGLKVLSGVTSGAIGSAIASPTDLLKVRMQAVRPTGKPPFRNTFVGFSAVYREGSSKGGLAGGIRSLYRGVGPTVIRAAVLTSSQIASYDQAKTTIKAQGWLDEGFGLHFSASMVAGFICSVTSQPFDVIKVRLMQDKERAFKNALDCAGKLIRHEGPLALYKGFGMCWARLGSHTVISLVLFEQLRALFGIKPL